MRFEFQCAQAFLIKLPAIKRAGNKNSWQPENRTLCPLLAREVLYQWARSHYLMVHTCIVPLGRHAFQIRCFDVICWGENDPYIASGKKLSPPYGNRTHSNGFKDHCANRYTKGCCLLVHQSKGEKMPVTIQSLREGRLQVIWDRLKHQKTD